VPAQLPAGSSSAAATAAPQALVDVGQVLEVMA